MIETALHLLIFFALAFFSGLIYPAFYAIIGAPVYVPHPFVDPNFGVQLLGISKPGMMGRWYGKWLCRKQNEFEREHDKSLISVFRIEIDGAGRIASKPYFRTSYGRESELHSIPAYFHPEIGITILSSLQPKPDLWEVKVKMLPGENAVIEYTDGERQTAYSAPLYPTFDRSKMPLSIYKALGLCGICTVFWFCFLSLGVGCMIGLFPLKMMLLTPVGYGLAVWASSLYEV
jgi:hypothetical protein